MRDIAAIARVWFTAPSLGGMFVDMPVGRRFASVMGLCGAMMWAAGCLGFESAGGIELDASGESGGTAQGFDPQPARGISIVEVEINQGTRVPVGVGGDWVDENARLAYLIASRDSLMRVHYTVAEGWVPRQIEARLTLELPDGGTKSVSKFQVIEGDSDPADFGGPFFFDLIASEGDTAVGTRYVVELWETEPGGEGLDEGDWSNPASGPQPIGFDSEPMQIKTLLVPMTYQGVTAALDEATTQMLLDNLYEQNPTTEIVYDIHEPVAYDGQLIDLANLLPIIAELRASENAAPNVYYHALIDVGSSSISGLYGISGIANDTEGDAGNRVSATVLWAPNPSFAANTYTHETGHAQGLSHVECSNAEAAAPDLAYPHPEGHIGNWGFAIRRFLMFGPDDAYDYMSYCGPSWVSDWTWNKTHQRIRTLTAWDFEAGASEPLEQLLVVAVAPDGHRQWWTMPGKIDPARVDGLDRIEFETSAGDVIVAYADVTTLSDGRTRWIKAALPSALSELSQIRHVRESEVASIGAATVGLGVASSWQPTWKTYRPR